MTVGSTVRERRGLPGVRGAGPRRPAQAYAIANKINHPTNVYLREDTLTEPLDLWLAGAFAAPNLHHTIAAMTDAQPVDTADVHAVQIPGVIARCDTKLTSTEPHWTQAPTPPS